jgi:hypothetical protein
LWRSQTMQQRADCQARASPERGAHTAHLTVSDFCRERLPGGPCTHWKALHRSKLLMQLHLPFSVRTAERLMAIARNPVLTKSVALRNSAASASSSEQNQRFGFFSVRSLR